MCRVESRRRLCEYRRRAISSVSKSAQDGVKPNLISLHCDSAQRLSANRGQCYHREGRL